MAVDEYSESAQAAPTPEEVGASYDEFGDLYGLILGYSAIHVGMWTPPDARVRATTMTDLADLAMDRQTDHYIAALGLGPGDHLLDIGCGTGGPAVRAARSTGARVTGITISGSQVGLGRERARAAGLADRVGFALADAMDLGKEYEDESYDAAWAIDSFAHMDDRLAVLRHAWRVLRPGGRLLFTEFTKRGEPTPEHLAVWRAVWTSPPPQAPATLLERVTEAGFDLERLEEHSHNLVVTGELMDVLYRDHHEAILERYGPDTTASMDTAMPKLREFIHDHLGYFVFVVRKPS